MAMPLGFVPTAIVIEEGVGTVSVLLPEIVPDEAEMSVEPGATLVARPPLLIVATAGLAEVQVTCVVILGVVPSE
jgi:hypothetical protein